MKPAGGECSPFADPDRNALDASIFWSPDICASVLTVRAEPVCTDRHEPILDISKLRCRTIILRGADGVEHVLFANNGRSLQLVVHGATIRMPVHLLTSAISESQRIERRLHLLRRLSDLVHRGDLSPRLYPPDPRCRRLAFVLRVLDGALAGASQRDIANALFGTSRVASDWTESGGYLRDRLRRAIRRGRWLMQGGYLTFLK